MSFPGSTVASHVFCSILIGFALTSGGRLLVAQAPIAPPVPPEEEDLRRCQELSSGAPAQAVKLAQSLLEKPEISPGGTIRATMCLAQAKAMAGDSKTATRMAERALDLANAPAVPPLFRAATAGNAGSVYQSLGNTQRAAELYKQAYELAKASNDPRAQLGALMSLGILYGNALDAPETANGYFSKARELGRMLGHEDPFLEFNYGYNLLQMKRYDEALVALDNAAALAGGQERFRGIKFRVNTAKARILAIRGEKEQARTLLTTAIAGQKAIQDIEGEATSQVALGNLELEEKHYQEAAAAAQKAVELGRKAHLVHPQVDGLRVIVEARKALNAAGQALEAQQKLSDLAIENLRTQNTSSIASLQAQLKDQAIESQYNRLKTETEMQRLRYQRTTMIRNLLVALLAFVLLAGTAFFFYQRKVRRKLHALSIIDPLTSLLNRREALRILGEHDAQYNPEEEKRTALFLLDVDHFKAINDQYGHDAGDQVLTVLAARIRSACRPADLVARWGGEEFFIAAWDITPQDAAQLAERLRISIRATPIKLPDGNTISITVSAGFAMHPFFTGARQGTWREAAYLADRVLYSAKRSGRNAWAGLWGTEKTADASLDAIHNNPEQCIKNGWAECASSGTVLW